MLRTADLLLCTSESESFGMSIAEAMATQVPVVATRTGGIVEVVEDGVSGLLAPVGDIQALAEAAVKILSCEERRQSYGQAALKRIHEKFHVDIITKLYEQLYEDVLERPDLSCPEIPFRLGMKEENPAS
ncbi:glycosyltransferase [bacterium]|nr:glycosyltransferase [bacterium]